MKLFKISTIVLAMALTGWVACGDDNNKNEDAPILSGTGGAVARDAPLGTGGAGGVGVVDGSTGTGGIDGGSPDIAIVPDGPTPPVDGGPLDIPVAEAGGGDGTTLCTGLPPAECHLAIINAATDPSISALDPGANPPILYPACTAQ